MLTQQLQITTFAALARADPQAIVDAMSGIRPPRPSLEEVQEWQEHARRTDEGAAAEPDRGAAAEPDRGAAAEPDRGAAAEPPGWEEAVGFVLSFEERQVEGGSERRLVAWQAEQEGEQESTSWPTWVTREISDEIADWLQRKLADIEAHDQTAAPQPQPAAAEPMPENRRSQSPREAGTRSGRGQLRILLATIADTTGRVQVVSDDRLTAQAVTCTVPGRLEVQVAGAETKRDVQVALRFARTRRPGWIPQPTTASADGKAEIELTEVPAGQYEARVLAWTPDASAERAEVGLGILTIR